MYWLYFAREFYRAGAASATETSSPCASAPHHATPAATTKTAYQHCTVSISNPALASETHDTTAHTPAALAPAPTDLSATYTHRLSVDGEQAFGVWDEEAGFSAFSANFERISGLLSGECAGHEFSHFIHHTQHHALHEALLGALHGINGRCLVQAQRLKSGATPRWLLLELLAAQSSHHPVMVLFRDISEERALEETLKQTEASLRMIERSRASFLSSMSHELRTPLNAIMGFSEMMKTAMFGELGNPIYQDYAHHIHDSGTALLQKINNLLDIANMDAGGLHLKESAFNLHKMLQETVEMHTHQAFARQQNLRLDCPAKLEIQADRSKLICASAHLISNALRHALDKTEITVSVRIQPDQGLIISVRDAGEGIKPAQLSAIRNALATDNAYFSIECDGIGLGLSLAKELAERHGGRIMIDSMRHRGTVVSLILPSERITRGITRKKILALREHAKAI